MLNPKLDLLSRVCVNVREGNQLLKALCDTGSVVTILRASSFPPRCFPDYTRIDKSDEVVQDASGRNLEFMGKATALVGVKTESQRLLFIIFNH